jgi:hypothetical protein
MKLHKLICIFSIATITTLYCSQERSSSEDGDQRRSPFDYQLVHFPAKEILRERLHSIGFGEFDEQTGLIENLHKKQPSKNPTGVAMIVELAYEKFIKDARENTTTYEDIIELSENKYILYETLLKGYPHGLNEIQATGLYKPNKRVFVKAKSL